MKNFIWLFSLLSSIAVLGQNKIEGTVKDPDNNPLAYVEIYAEELHRGTLTDENGRFELENISNKKIKLIISYLGYNTQYKIITLEQQTTTLNITMTEAVFQVDEIIIATPFQRLQSENVMKVDRITTKGVQKTGATTLVQGLENIAGVSQISTGTGIGKPVIRGLSGNRVLVYTQGIRLENQQYGDEHGLGINDAGIESIEVIKGPASLLYGSDALGGVLYLNPERFASQNTTITNVNQRFFGNTLGSSSSIGLKSSTTDWKYLVRGTYATHSDYTVPNGDRVTNTRFNEKDLKTGIGYSKNEFSTVLRYNFNRSTIGLTEGIADQTRSKTVAEPYQLIDNHIVSLHSHYYFGEAKLEADLGFTFNDRNEFEEHEDVADHEEAALQMDLKTYSYNIKYHQPFGEDIQAVFGVQGMHQTNTNFGEELLIPNATIKDFGVFSTFNFDWNTTNTLQAGIRFDQRGIVTERHEVVHDTEVHVFEAIDNNYTSFTASLGYKTTLWDGLVTRLNIASGFRAPNLAELTSNGVHHGTNRYEVGNNDLKNEKNLQLDLSLTYDTEHVEFFANGFHNTIDNYIYITPTGEVEDGSPVFNYVQDNATLYGGEFGLHFHPHPLDWLHLESSFETVTGKQENGAYLPLIPANSLKNTLRTEFDASWIKQGYASIKMQNVFAQNNVSQFETATPNYTLLDLGLGGDVRIANTNVSVSFAVRNLTNTRYINHLSRLKNDGILNPGRNVVLGIQFSL